MYKKSKKNQNVIIIDTDEELFPEQEISAVIQSKKSNELEKLIAKNITNLTEQFKSQALHLSIENNFIEGVRLLLECDANIFAKNTLKQTAYQVAAAKPDQGIFEVIKQHVYLRVAQANAKFFDLARSRSTKVDTMAKAFNQALTRKINNLPVHEVINTHHASARATILALSYIYKVGLSRINNAPKLLQTINDQDNTKTIIAKVFNFKNGGLNKTDPKASKAWPILHINCRSLDLIRQLAVFQKCLSGQI